MAYIHTATLPKNLSEWRDKLCEKEMPIFSGTVQRINAILDDAKTSATELAHIVMADPSLSTKVLKLSNNIYYNPSRQPIGTLTKAITLLGSHVVNELALTASYIEAIQSARNRSNANREIMDALHAAVQAKALAQLCHDPAPEEVFLATLLYRIGHVAFWCFEDSVGEKIGRLMQSPNIAAEDAEQQVLGFKLHELGVVLTKAWQIKGLIAEVHQGKSNNPLRISLVKQAHEIVKLHKHGELMPDEVKAVMLPLGKSVTQTPEQMIEFIKDNTQTTLTLATQYGVENAVLLLRAPGDSIDLPLEPLLELPPLTTEERTLVIYAPSSEERKLILQRIQQDISGQLSGDFDLNPLFEMIMEGIQRGIPMERVLLALIDREHSIIREKSAIGWGSPKSRALLEVPIADFKTLPNTFTYTLQGNAAVWIRPADGPKWEKLYTPVIESQFGRFDCFIAPLTLNERHIGVMYADRALSNTLLDQEAFNTFSHLTQQATFGLKLSQLRR